jgi:hypothetical protein
MRGVNDRNFLNAWHILQRATCPSATQMTWNVGDVAWQKERHSFSGGSYSVSLEIHLLRCGTRGANAWQLMMVLEYWWDGEHEMIKNSTWGRVLDGNPKAVLAWLREQEQGPGRAAAS